ncbi:hypothetical protein [Candidatus Pelagibacter sp.]|uniref:hypothetical protein n=1 Tax=Candidatus Pelagibacter sp. TaxID=2024849 RepID=UPI003F86E419
MIYFKKILSIIVISLLFGVNAYAFFKNAKETAIENCADADWLRRYHNQPSYYLKNIPEEMYQEIYNSSDLSISRGNIDSGNFNTKNAYDEFLKFAKETFEFTEDERIDWTNTAYKISIGFKKEEVVNELPAFKLKENFKSVEAEKRKQLMDLFDTLASRMKFTRYAEEFLKKAIAVNFSELKIKKKFKNELYAKRYRRCEETHNELPSSFINEWEDGDQVKEIKDKILK